LPGGRSIQTVLVLAYCQSSIARQNFDNLEESIAVRENFEEGYSYYLVLDLISGGEMLRQYSQAGYSGSGYGRVS
jgi:hypothetical protein